MVKILIVVMFLSGCGKTIEQEIQQYVEVFESYYGKAQPCSIIFKPELDKPTTAGKAFNGVGSCWVEISLKHWNTFNSSQRECLIMHELGHAVLRRDHTNAKKSNGQPASIMNSYLLEGFLYSDNKDYYLLELFSRN